jgi:hypothetical protein
MCFPVIGAAMLGYTGTGSVAAATAATGLSSTGLGIMGASAVAGVASPLVSYAGQRQQARQQARYQAQAQAAERQRFMQEQTAIRMRQLQEQVATGEEMFDISKDTVRATDTAAMKARAQGMAGLNVDAIIDDVLTSSGNLQNRLTQQIGMKETATTLGLEQAQFVTTQRQIGLAKPIQRPSLALSGFQALSGGLDAYTRGRQIGATYES